MTTKISQLSGGQIITSVSADNPITFSGKIGSSNPSTGTFTNVSANNIRTSSVTADSGVFKDVAASSLSIINSLSISSGGLGFGSYTNGQLLIGNSSGTLTRAAVTPGSGVSVSAGNGSIELNAATGGGALQLLATVTANNSAAIEVTAAFLTSAYPIYEFEFVNILPAITATNLYAQVSENNGSTYAAGTSYRYAGFLVDAGNPNIYIAAADGVDRLTVAVSASNTSTHGINGRATLYAPLDTSHFKDFMAYGTNIVAPQDVRRSKIGGSYKATTNAINAIKFYFSSGNIASGLIKIYGKS